MSGIDRIREQRMGAQVWKARDRAGIAPDVLAGKIGVSPSEIHALENGTHPRIGELAPKALGELSQRKPGTSRIVNRVTQHLN